MKKVAKKKKKVVKVSKASSKKSGTKQLPFPSLVDILGFFYHAGILDSEVFVSPQYLNCKAKKKGATMSISILNGRADFYFNKEGAFLGTSTQQENSWKPFKGTPKTLQLKRIL